jgi:predicted short-subunit dehydrogenase-like oxidoreductase (DUF2520 family)
MDIHTIVLIGSGNVATHAGQALVAAGQRILQVFSRREAPAHALAALIGAEAITDPRRLHPSADLYILSLNDSSYLPFLRSITLRNRLMVHTSGSIPADVFREFTGHYGVLYPLQTFTKDRKVNFREVPLLVEGSDPAIEEVLLKLARSIADTVERIDSEKRRKIHLAAVFASNFVNHLLSLSAELLTKEGVDIHLLAPLVRETCEKALLLMPAEAQTGPAMRRDWNVIEKHLEMLKDRPEFREIYDMLSKSIASRYKE